MRTLLDRVQAAVGDDGRLSSGATASWDALPVEGPGHRSDPVRDPLAAAG